MRCARVAWHDDGRAEAFHVAEDGVEFDVDRSPPRFLNHDASSDIVSDGRGTAEKKEEETT